MKTNLESNLNYFSRAFKFTFKILLAFGLCIFCQKTFAEESSCKAIFGVDARLEEAQMSVQSALRSRDDQTTLLLNLFRSMTLPSREEANALLVRNSEIISDTLRIAKEDSLSVALEVIEKMNGTGRQEGELRRLFENAKRLGPEKEKKEKQVEILLRPSLEIESKIDELRQDISLLKDILDWVKNIQGIVSEDAIEFHLFVGGIRSQIDAIEIQSRTLSEQSLSMTLAITAFKDKIKDIDEFVKTTLPKYQNQILLPPRNDFQVVTVDERDQSLILPDLYMNQLKQLNNKNYFKLVKELVAKKRKVTLPELIWLGENIRHEASVGEPFEESFEQTGAVVFERAPTLNAGTIAKTFTGSGRGLIAMARSPLLLGTYAFLGRRIFLNHSQAIFLTALKKLDFSAMSLDEFAELKTYLSKGHYQQLDATYYDNYTGTMYDLPYFEEILMPYLEKKWIRLHRR